MLAVAILVGSAEFAFGQLSNVLPNLDPAAPGFRLGELRIHPALSLKGEYQSNVFQTATNEQDDFLATLVPGVGLELPVGRHRFTGGYRAEFLKFVQRSNQDTTHHIAGLGMNLDFPVGLLVKLENQFKKTSEPPASDLTGRLESLQNNLASSLEYRLADRYSVGLSHSLDYTDFKEQENEFLDRFENRFGLTGYYRIFPKTSLLLDYTHGRIDYINNTERNATSHSIQTGVRGELTAKLQTLFKIGWQIRQSEESGRGNFTGLVTSGTWNYEMTNRTTWTLLTERRLIESSFANNDFFEALVGSLGVNHVFNPRLTLRAKASAGLNEYTRKATVGTKTDDRDDFLFGVGAGFNYNFRRWLSISIDYLYNRRDSNFNDFDYKDHRATVGLHFAL